MIDLVVSLYFLQIQQDLLAFSFDHLYETTFLLVLFQKLCIDVSELEQCLELQFSLKKTPQFSVLNVKRTKLRVKISLTLCDQINNYDTRIRNNITTWKWITIVICCYLFKLAVGMHSQGTYFVSRARLDEVFLQHIVQSRVQFLSDVFNKKGSSE